MTIDELVEKLKGKKCPGDTPVGIGRRGRFYEIEGVYLCEGADDKTDMIVVIEDYREAAL